MNKLLVGGVGKFLSYLVWEVVVLLAAGESLPVSFQRGRENKWPLPPPPHPRLLTPDTCKGMFLWFPPALASDPSSLVKASPAPKIRISRNPCGESTDLFWLPEARHLPHGGADRFLALAWKGLHGALLPFRPQAATGAAQNARLGTSWSLPTCQLASRFVAQVNRKRGTRPNQAVDQSWVAERLFWEPGRTLRRCWKPEALPARLLLDAGDVAE